MAKKNMKQFNALYSEKQVKRFYAIDDYREVLENAMTKNNLNNGIEKIDEEISQLVIYNTDSEQNECRVASTERLLETNMTYKDQEANKLKPSIEAMTPALYPAPHQSKILIQHRKEITGFLREIKVGEFRVQKSANLARFRASGF